MSWDDLITTGSGFVDYRLMVEGWPHQWVTHPRIAPSDAAGRTVYPGLAFEGLRISERMVLREAWPEVDGITAKIVPTDSNEDTLYGFTRYARPVADLYLSIEAVNTAWATQPELLPAGMYHVATEAILHDGTNGITRAQWDTIQQQHLIDDGIIPQPVKVYTWPPSMQGRHAYLYAYGSGDDPESAGTLIWRGVVSQPPRMDSDGVSWLIEIGPITTQFDQVLGASDKYEYKLRGIYHSDRCPAVLYINTGGSFENIPVGPLYVMGFFETQAELDTAINAAFDAGIADAGIGSQVAYVLHNGSTGTPYATVAANYAADFVLTVVIHDDLDGHMDARSPGYPSANGHRIDVGGLTKIQRGNAAGEFWVLANQVPPWTYPLPQARGLVGEAMARGPNPLFQDVLLSSAITDPTYPHDRVYLSTVDGLEVGDTLVIKSGDNAARTMTITAIDTTDRFITVEFAGDDGIYVSSDSTITQMRIYGQDTHWHGFIQEVVAQSPEANQGDTPWLTAADLDNSLWGVISGYFPIDDYWRHRDYRFIKQVRVRDVFAPELMVTGFMARLSSDGRVDVVQLPFVSAVRTPNHTLTDNEILPSAEGMAGMFPTWEAQSDGLVNIAKIRLGYNPLSDEFNEYGDYVVRVVSSIAEHKSGDKATQEIEVRSTPAGRTTAWGKLQNIIRGPIRLGISTVQVVDAITPYLRCLSTDYAAITVAVPFTKFGVLVGDIVAVTSDYIPDGNGARGVVSAKSICVGRTWELDPAAGGMGTLTLWIPLNPPTGYAPTGRITDQTDEGSNVWALELDSADDFNLAWAEGTDGKTISHFSIGDYIQIVQVDSTSPTIVTGLVTDVDPDTDEIVVELDDSWDPGSDTWNLRFAFVDDIIVARQQTYCWVADDGALLVDDTPAREFA